MAPHTTAAGGGGGGGGEDEVSEAAAAASPALRHRHAGKGEGEWLGGNGAGAGADGGQAASVERVFADKAVLSWREQLTLRAFVVSALLAVMFSVIVMKLNLTTGIIPSLNVSAGLLGFFFVRMWTAAVERMGFLRQPFTRQENTVVQTCVVACSGIAFSGMQCTPCPSTVSTYSGSGLPDHQGLPNRIHRMASNSRRDSSSFMDLDWAFPDSEF